MLIDRIRLTVQAGAGGNGCESYFRRTDKKLVPHGGDGGIGGSVIFRADPNGPPLANLRFKPYLAAESGGHGGSSRKRGKNGKDLIVPLPVGTRIYDRNRHLLVRELSQAGEEVVILAGGKGGNGNQGGKQASPGEKGAALDLELSLQIRADVFLVGLPNSGKSKILNTLTRSRAKEEAYPFATDSPQMGVYSASEHEPILLCELPSLYRSSHEGRGRGSSFLKHLEGAKFILYVLDPVSRFSKSLQEGYETLRKEIAIFNPQFLEIPHGVVINKMDLPEAQERVRRESFEPNVPTFKVSALSPEGLLPLKSFFHEEILK